MAFCGLSGGSALPQGEHLTNGRSVTDVLFTPIRLGPLEVKNRLFRSSAGGRFDNYDGSGTPVRINWDLKVAQGLSLSSSRLGHDEEHGQ